MPRIGSGIPLVGRARELAKLRTALAMAAEGQANAVLLAGDAGVGKSRLLTELVTVARQTGTTVFTGRCLDVDDAGLPYLPFVEALGQLTTAQREVAARHPVLGRLMPGLAPAEASQSAMEQLRLFDSVHGLFSDLATEGPVLVAIEDLHWADASTRDLVHFLVSRLYTQRILIVGTYRVDDLHRRHPLRALLGELLRLSSVELLELKPFDHVDTVAFVDALSDSGLPPETVRKIAERSEGNAFFCEELTAVYGDGAGVPAGLAELLLARVERLGSDARRVVRAASVASETVTHESLAAVSGLADDVLEEALRESVQLNVLVTVHGGYSFRHSLLREAVYGDLLPGERVRLHAGYARVVSSQALLAYHSFRSHDLPGALAASVRAAEEAGKMGAPGEKLRHVEQALELWDAVPDPASAGGIDELSLLCMATRAADVVGESYRAVEYGRSAVALADLRDDPELAAETRHQLAIALMPLEYRAADVQLIVDQAWELVRDRPASVTRARVLALCARQWVWDWGDLDLEMLQNRAREAIADAQQVGATAVEVDALVTLAVFADWMGKFDEALDVGRVAAQRAAAMGAFSIELRAHKNIAIMLATYGRLAETVELIDFVVRRSVEVGLEWSVWGVDARLDQVVFRYYSGDWPGAIAAGELSGAPTMAWTRVTAPTLWVLAAQGEFARLGEKAEEIAKLTDDPLTHVLAGIGTAEAAIWQGEPQDAVEKIDKVFDIITTSLRSSPLDLMTAVCVGVWALADVAEQARRRHDPDAVREAVTAGERLAALADANQPKGKLSKLRFAMSHPQTIQFLSRLNAELSRLKGEDDPALWLTAAEKADVDYWQAVARWRRAAALLAAGDRDEATSDLLAAYSIATRLGAAPLRSALVALARRGRITLPDAAPEPSSGLTPRELAVLELVAAGLTNKQVGAQLYISQKTASVHLSRVMAKLGATNRTEVVSIAHDRGLLGLGEHQG